MTPRRSASKPRDIRDMLMYRISRLATIGDRTGQLIISRKFGLNVGDWRVFGIIHALEPVTLAGLAQELYLDKGQLSRTVSGLMQAGLVSQRASESDRRQSYFETTAKGRRTHADVLAYIVRRNAELLGSLDRAEQGEFFRLLDKVTATSARSYDDLFGARGRSLPAADRRAAAPEAKRAAQGGRRERERSREGLVKA